MNNKVGIIGAILALGSTLLIAMANSSTFDLVSCKYSPEDKYVWIKMANGVTEKGVSFVSDGVIFNSSVPGMTYAKDYSDIHSVTFGSGSDGLGLLKVEFLQDGVTVIEEVGVIDEQCWQNLQALLARIPESRHVGMNGQRATSRIKKN